jgi:hypothetical protein
MSREDGNAEKEELKEERRILEVVDEWMGQGETPG